MRRSAVHAVLRRAFPALCIVIGLVLLLLLGEAAVRLIPHVSDRFSSFRFRQYDPLLGISLIPGSAGPHHRDCFKGEIFINGWGMRDRERQLGNESHVLRIALLGDSVVEGAHVRPNEVVNIVMEDELPRSIGLQAEVLNFGIASTGTTQQLLHYENLVHRFHSDIVVLAFLVGNDVMNNSARIQSRVYGIHKWYSPYFEIDAEGRLVLEPVEPKRAGRIAALVQENLRLAYYLERIWARVNFAEATWEDIPLSWGVFAQRPDPDWENAWLVTERVLGRLQDAVHSDGSAFMVLVLPEPFDVYPDWRSWMREKVGNVPENFSPSRSNERLREIASREGLTLDFLAPVFQKYRDEHRLQPPYFSLPCDPHFSELGHKVLANAIIAKLDEHEYLPAGRRDAPPAAAPVD